MTDVRHGYQQNGYLRLTSAAGIVPGSAGLIFRFEA